MENRLSKGLRLMSTGEIVSAVGVLGLLGSALMMVAPVLSDRVADARGILRLSFILVAVTGIATLAGAVICLVAQVKLRGESPNYRRALIWTLVGMGVNFVKVQFELEGLWAELLTILFPCMTTYLIVMGTNEFLAAREREDLIRQGNTARTVYLTMAPFGALFNWGLGSLLQGPGMEDSLGLILAAAVAAVLLSMVPVVLIIRYLRSAAAVLERGPWDEPISLKPAE